MLDINELKKVNDTMGHSTGDELIKICSTIIETTFGQLGDTYRIGGDEFIVLLWNEHAEEMYVTAREEFRKKQLEINQSSEYQFLISIACGAGFCTPVNKDIITQTQHTADQLMYQDKLALKRAILPEVLKKQPPARR